MGYGDSDSLPFIGRTFKKGIVDRVFLGNETDIDTFSFSERPDGGIAGCIKFKDLEPNSDDGASIETRDSHFAQPLLRGVVDSIRKNDSILFIEIDKTFYWLGPINTTNNPSDPGIPKIIPGEVKEEFNYISSNSGRKNTDYDVVLDNPGNMFDAEPDSPLLDNGKFNDLSIEGRHDNVITLGSRGFSPFVKIQNNSSVVSTIAEDEQIKFENEGSLLGMFSAGALYQHIPNYIRLSSDKEIDEYNKNKGDTQYTATTIGIGNDNGQDRFDINYSFISPVNPDLTDFDQILIFSDRIVFDASRSDLTFSAKRNIDFGAAGNFTLNTKGRTFIQSENIYLGDSKRSKKEPLVLGEELRKLLNDIVNILTNAHALVQGVPLPLVDATGAPLRLSGQSVNSTRNLEIDMLEQLTEREINDNGVYQIGPTPFLSHHHYIEQNDRSTNEG
tara:strand:+ start:373 stop:1707 length:1335 start_codon:yes stop_codon:yes gene_type:complete